MGGTQETRIPLALAENIARAILAELRPLCERIEVAGSVRRRSPDVGDIEFVCIPKFIDREAGLFGDPEAINLLDESLEFRIAQRTGWRYRLDARGASSFGPRAKRLTYGGTPVDLYSVLPPASWGVIMAIRTGPARFAHRMVMQDSQTLEGAGSGMLTPWERVQDGQLWRNGQPVPTPTEHDFFREIRQPWREPWNRR